MYKLIVCILFWHLNFERVTAIYFAAYCWHVLYSTLSCLNSVSFADMNCLLYHSYNWPQLNEAIRQCSYKKLTSIDISLIDRQKYNWWHWRLSADRDWYRFSSCSLHYACCWILLQQWQASIDKIHSVKTTTTGYQVYLSPCTIEIFRLVWCSIFFAEWT